MFLDLGFTPPADQFRRKEQMKEQEIYYPLQVSMCDDCGLAQLTHVVSPEILYRNDYPYESSLTKTGRAHWESFAREVIRKYGLGINDLIVDIGSNVGTLLEAFKKNGTTVQGVDPAANIVMLAEKSGIDTICDFFNAETVEIILEEKGNASVVTATNVFAHINDLHLLMSNIRRLLKKRGIFIFEAPYFVNLIKQIQYDTIYHEHLSYLSVKPLVSFLYQHNMEMIDIKFADIHGGSFRVYISEKGNYPVSRMVKYLFEKENDMALYSHAKLDEFAANVKRNREELRWLLHSLKREGKSIVGVSAPAKGMTLLNYCRIGNDWLDVVSEKSKLKVGRYTPGTHIPVVSDDYLLERQPDYALLLAWNFAEEIMNNLVAYRKRGGKFIIPIPIPKII
jgi:SAM-dependent methyltransferase